MIKFPLPSFRRRATIAFAVYAFAVVLVVVAIGGSLNERVEESVWNTMLQIEIEQLKALRPFGSDAGSNEHVRTYVQPKAGQSLVAVPEEISRLRPGFHDDVELDGRIWAVLVQDDLDSKAFLAFDITQLEADEAEFQNWGLIAVVSMLVLLTALGYFIAGRVSEPVLALAKEVAARDPDSPLIAVERKYRDLETSQIASAIDGYLSRIDALLRREKEFLAAVSHELRTPIAVIRGANDILNGYSDLPEQIRRPIDRIVRAANDADSTLTVLLFLAREEEQLHIEYKACQVDKLVPSLLSDHEHLLNERQQIRVGSIESTQAYAPPRLIGIALGNILRNAIQHGQAGPIEINIIGGIFTVTDVGPGIPEATLHRLIKQQYANRTVAGYGLYIVQRIANRLGWKLRIDSEPGKRTTVSLVFREGRD